MRTPVPYGQPDGVSTQEDAMHAASTQTVQFAKAYRTEQMRAAEESRTRRFRIHRARRR